MAGLNQEVNLADPNLLCYVCLIGFFFLLVFCKDILRTHPFSEKIIIGELVYFFTYMWRCVYICVGHSLLASFLW